MKSSILLLCAALGFMALSFMIGRTMGEKYGWDAGQTDAVKFGICPKK
jgi:hypothetical protein